MSQRQILEVLKNTKDYLSSQEICENVDESIYSIQRNLNKMRKYKLIKSSKKKIKGRSVYIYGLL